MGWRGRGFAMFGVAIAVAVACLVVVPAAAAASTSAFSQARQAALAGRHPDAVQLLRAYLAVSPRDAAAWVWLGASYYQLKQYRPAGDAFGRAVALSHSPDIALWQGAAYAALGRADAAR
ncbi:MAG: hypothetical protein ACRDGN_13440, partial [bacterium]